MDNVKIPGTLWTSIFIVLSMLPQYLEMTFAGAEWLPAIVGAIVIVLKIWEVYKPTEAHTPDDDDMEFASFGMPIEETNRVSRVLWG